MTTSKQQIITFKADPQLAEAIRRLPNASEFIRHAILSAMKHSCPLCQGTGILSPSQMEHWKRFAQDHPLEECDHCHALHVVCSCDGTHDEDDPHAAH